MGRTNGACGTPAGAEKQRLLQRAVEPQFSPFEQLKEGKEAVNASETRVERFGSDMKGTCCNYVEFEPREWLFRTGRASAAR